MEWMSQYNPSDEMINVWRTINVILSGLGCMVLVVTRALPNWSDWNVPQRLGWMSKFLFCFAIFYGTFELLYLPTLFRVPMASLAVLWAIIAALWPDDREHLFFKKSGET